MTFYYFIFFFHILFCFVSSVCPFLTLFTFSFFAFSLISDNLGETVGETSLLQYPELMGPMKNL